MPDVTFNASILLAGFGEMALRVWLVVAGLLVAGHYHCMANFIGRAPHAVRALVLPSISGAGIGMAFCGAVGATLQGALFGAAAAGLMAVINLAAWGAGAYVSAQLERAAEMRAQIRREGWAFVHDYRSLAEAVNTPDHDATTAERPAHHRQAAERERAP